MLERHVERCGAGIGTTEENGDPWDAYSGLRTRLTRNREQLARQHGNEHPPFHR
jgi:hypothetical protein